MDLVWHGPGDDSPTLLLAHSAGAPMDSPWMNAIASHLADHGIRTVRFEFAFMAARREGRRPPPPRAELVADEYRDAVAAAVEKVGSPVLVGGKSYGGRVASLIADDVSAAGLVCLGYPFHPPQRPEQLRTAHLLTLRTPALICQGERDPFGGPDQVASYGLPSTIEVRWFAGAHDVQPAGRLGTVADAIAGFVETLSTPRR